MSIDEIQQVAGDQNTLDAVLARVRPILAGLSAEAARRERERELPLDAVRELAAAGVGALRVPREYGGGGVSLRQLFELIIEVSDADPNVAQALRGHYGFVESLLGSADRDQWDRWFPRVVAGAIVGNATSELGTTDLRTAQTRLRREGELLLLDGEKFYSTGTLYADLVAVIATTDQETRASVVVPVGRPGVELVDDWDGFGQRLSASGATRFHRVVVDEDEVQAADWENAPPNHLVPFFQLFLAGVQAGIGRTVQRDVIDVVRTRRRTYGTASAQTPREDHLVLQVVGEIAADVFAAEALVLAAADRLDRAYATTLTGTPDPAEHLSAAITVAETQTVVTRHVLAASEALFDAGSASTTDRARNLDRHWRNTRTLASHNPLIYKARVVGDYLVNQTPPPFSGYL